jgi:hypothetical protein
VRPGLFLEGDCQAGDRLLERGFVGDHGAGAGLFGDGGPDGRLQRIDPDPFRGDDGNHRATELARQGLGVHHHSLALGDVHHVQNDQQRYPHFGELAGQVQVALEVRSIDDVDDEIRLVGMHVVARHLFVQRDLAVHHVERVGARQVDDFETAVAEAELAALALDGDAGPVADTLPGAGEGVEQGRLATVGIAHQSDAVVVFAGHQSFSTERTAASSRRSDSEQPRTRISTGSPIGARRVTLISAPGVSPKDSSLRR